MPRSVELSGKSFHLSNPEICPNDPSHYPSPWDRPWRAYAWTKNPGPRQGDISPSTGMALKYGLRWESNAQATDSGT